MSVARTVGAYAGRVFDHHAEHPVLARLLLWEGLNLPGEVPDEATRTDHYRRKVATFAQAQRDGLLTDELPPGDLLLTIIALAAWWSATPQLARMITGTDADPAELARRRATGRGRRPAAGVAELTARPGGTRTPQAVAPARRHRPQRTRLRD